MSYHYMPIRKPKMKKTDEIMTESKSVFLCSLVGKKEWKGVAIKNMRKLWGDTYGYDLDCIDDFVDVHICLNLSKLHLEAASILRWRGI